MNDMTPLEESSVEYASKMAGEYLDTLRTTDLSRFTQEQWDTLIKIICINYEMYKFTNTLSTDMFPSGESK